MGGSQVIRSRAAVRSLVLFGGVVAVAGGLVSWKQVSAHGASGAADYEPAEVVTAAVAEATEHRSAATSIGTVLATRSITLRNEVPGTVRRSALRSGEVVGAGTLLVALDVSVEEAELKAQQARVELAERNLARLQRMAEQRAVSAMELDNARAERDVARAEVERTRAVIERKTIRAPFRARVGIADVHPGQFLDAGTLLTTLQGLDDDAHVHFSVAQAVGSELRAGDAVDVFVGDDVEPATARVTAVDARVDPGTRTAMVRARLDGAGDRLAPGASVRVRVPVGERRTVVLVPVGALRKGPGGDHVFVIDEASGQPRASSRRVQAAGTAGDQVIIVDGLAPGERVAVAGSFKLREGALVHVSDELPAQGGR